VVSRTPSIRRRLLSLVLAATAPLVLAIVVAVGGLGLLIWHNSIESIESRTKMLHEAVDSALREAIVGYLRAKTESALSTIATVEDAWSELGETRVLGLIERHLLATTVKTSGYLYVINTDGRVVIHPDPETQGRVIPEVEPVATQLITKNGYMEYSWQNSFEPVALPKALFMAEYPPRGWIVGATAYREEFVDLVNRDRLATLVAPGERDPATYSVVVDRYGELVFHPDFRGRNLAEFFDEAEAARIMDLLFSQRAGQVRYSWPDRMTGGRVPKLLVSRYMPDFDWAVATTIDIRSLRRPIVGLSLGAGALVFALVALVVLVALRMAESVSDPITRLSVAAESGGRADPGSLRRTTPREVRLLVDRFDTFVDRIEHQQRSLERGIDEKTVLLRELHHRVKNNLQVVAGLLNLQSSAVVDPRDEALFARTRDRVLSIALVHEQLYKTNDLHRVPFDLYLQELTGHIRASMDADAIALEVVAESIALDVDVAIPCGMIVNELVSNAYKHAFAEADSGLVRVSVGTEENLCVLEVADSGIGMPDDARQSLGMTLVHMLVEQIGGTVEVVVGNGTTLRVRVPAGIPDRV
jgi:two-component sensor histidine kinase